MPVPTVNFSAAADAHSSSVRRAVTDRRVGHRRNTIAKLCYNLLVRRSECEKQEFTLVTYHVHCQWATRAADKTQMHRAHTVRLTQLHILVVEVSKACCVS